MTQEDKELLLRDLCARLPYGVKLQTYSYEENIETIETLREIDSDGYISTLECDTLKNTYKPYLYPPSSMTEEQKEELAHIVVMCGTLASSQLTHMTVDDWFNKNRLDYRGLIPMGLAEDATDKNIY